MHMYWVVCDCITAYSLVSNINLSCLLLLFLVSFICRAGFVLAFGCYLPSPVCLCIKFIEKKKKVPTYIEPFIVWNSSTSPYNIIHILSCDLGVQHAQYVILICNKWREGYLVPTWAWKITCRRFDWMFQLSSGQNEDNWNIQSKHRQIIFWARVGTK